MTGSTRLKTASEPIFSVPPVMTATLAVLALIQAVRTLLLPQQADIELLLWLAFIPARYDATSLLRGAYPGGVGADAWTFVTYALLHGDWFHLGLNAVWFLAFGTPVARRFGPTRFLAFLVVTAAAGAAAHLASHRGDALPMIGASAAISACMAAAIRFVFQRHGPLGLLGGRTDAPAHAVPAAPLAASLRDPRIIAFLAVWLGLNLLFGASSLTIVPEGQSVAWQAHVGGFAVGLLAFSAFDPIGREPSGRAGDSDPSATESSST